MKMPVNILTTLLSVSCLTTAATSPGHLKRTTILDATCKSGYSVETSHLDPDILICCPKGSSLGGWGIPVIPGLTLMDIKGPICCPDTLTPEQCNADDNDQRKRPDNVKDCWFNYEHVDNTSFQGRFVCAQPGVNIPTSASLSKRAASTINTDSADSDEFDGGQVMHAVCSEDEHGLPAISAVGRETMDALNTICCPQDYSQGGWSEAGEPVCCQKLNDQIIDCGGEFTYRVPAESVINCRGLHNNMVIYGNTSVCEGPPTQQSRPEIYAMPKPAGPIARPKTQSESFESPGGKREGAAKRKKIDNTSFCLKHPEYRECQVPPGSIHVNSTYVPRSFFGRSDLKDANITCPNGTMSGSLEDSVNVDICCLEDYPVPIWLESGKPSCCNVTPMHNQCEPENLTDPIAPASCGNGMAFQNKKGIQVCATPGKSGGSRLGEDVPTTMAGLLTLAILAVFDGW